MRKNTWYWLAVAVTLCAGTSACGEDKTVGAADGSIEACDDDEDCEGSQLPPGDRDSAVDEDEPPRDAGDRETDEDTRDAMQVDEEPAHATDAEVDDDVDEDVDESVDPEPDAGSDPEPDAGQDAEVEDPIDCRDYDCGFGTCDETKAPTTCDCVTGYADEGSGCAWTGAITDQELEDPSAWTGPNMTFENGVARFDSQGTGLGCELGLLEQTIEMPERAESEAFVIELDVLSPCTSTDPEQCAPLQLELGESATRLVAAGGPGAGTTPVARTLTACLGGASYGGDVQLRVRPGLAYQHGELPLQCETAQWPAIDRIAIRPAATGECAALDALSGGRFSSEGWSLINATVSGDRVRIEEGGRAEISATLDAMREGEFLRLSADAGGAYVDVEIDGLRWARMQSGMLYAMCFPHWAHGAGHRIVFKAASGPVALSSVSIGQEASCGDGQFDSSFDQTSSFGSWSSSEGSLRYVFGFTGRGVELTQSTTLRAATRFGARVAGRRWVASARYRGQINQTNIVRYSLDPGPGQTTEGNALQEYWVCLPDAWEHQLATLRLDIQMTPEAPATAVNMFLDDLYIRTTEAVACP